ncbi:MAG: hypothetical protein IIC79_05780 [Chloroflexi bacterium]|nr:hypothetical protein [Chloroflexota bacterium]
MLDEKWMGLGFPILKSEYKIFDFGFYISDDNKDLESDPEKKKPENKEDTD